MRPFALLRTGDQWMRCSFDETSLDPQTGIVSLASTTASAESTSEAPAVGGGLAFDRECRLYHSVAKRTDGSPDRVERLLWKAFDPLSATQDQTPLNLFGGGAAQRHGDFSAPNAASPLAEPRGLAVDQNDRLFVAERGNNRILVYDLWSDRLIRRVGLADGAGPADLAAHRDDVYAVLAGAHQIVRLTASSGPQPFTLPAGCTEPSRIAISPAGQIAILERMGTADARVWFVNAAFPSVAVAMATDVEWESESVIVVARQPKADFPRYRLVAGNPPVVLASLRGRDYNGLGIVALPAADCSCAGASVERRIGYWTDTGFRATVQARPVYARSGVVTTFRLDSGAYQTVWGRLFVDACIPEGADLRVHFIVADDVDEGEPAIAREAPANVDAGFSMRHAELSPPLPPAVLMPEDGDIVQPLHRRESGRELPWTEPTAADAFETYETPIDAPPGRYLWVTLQMRGNTRVSPRIKCIRAEHPAHDYLRRLPRTFSRNETAASFLLRYLSIFEGFLGEAEARSVDRDVLLNPWSTPDDCLQWLASFVGLTLDDRWAHAPAPCNCSATDARRRIIAEAAWLFRYRGTLPGLKRFIELYVGMPVIVIEKFRTRGAGAVVLGGHDPYHSSVVGVGFRIGGDIAGDDANAETDSTHKAEHETADAFRKYAHRFTVIIPAVLTDEQLDVVRHIIDVHRPAHTIFDICTAGAGMRAGNGLLVGVSSVIGPTGGFSTFQIGGASVVGRGVIVGRPESGGSLGLSRLGSTTRIG